MWGFSPSTSEVSCVYPGVSKQCQNIKPNAEKANALDVGDSGGPLIDVHAPRLEVKEGKPDLDLLLGIISFGEDSIDCGESTRPGVYTRVISYLDWIAGKLVSVKILGQKQVIAGSTLM